MSVGEFLDKDTQINKVDHADVILIIDDDQDVRESLQDIIEIELPQFSVFCASNGKEALQLAKAHSVSIALIDIKLGKSSGLDLVQPIKHIHDHTICIMMTAFREAEYAVEAVQQGADDYLFKPIEPHKLFKTIARFQRRLELEREKREAEKRFKAIFEQSFQMIFLLDGSGVTIDVNQTALDVLAEKKRNIVGCGFSELDWWDSFDNGRDDIVDAIKGASGGSVFHGEVVRSGTGAEFHYAITIKPVSIGRNDVLLVAECRDVTDQRLMEKMLLEAKERLEDRVRARTEDLEQAKLTAEKANQAKTVFLSQISHELRTPLNAILGFSQILQMNDGEKGLSSEQTTYVDEINVAGERLLELINTLLDLTQIESGKFTMNIEDVGLDLLLAGVVSAVQTEADQRQIKILNTVNHSGLKVLADSHYLNKILFSLLSNAIEYNKIEGSVTLYAEILKDTGRVLIRVVDTGIGIAKNVQHRVFQPFDRLDRVTHVDGAGIALALAKKLIELQGGSIGFDSEENEGSCFWLELKRVD